MQRNERIISQYQLLRHTNRPVLRRGKMAKNWLPGEPFLPILFRACDAGRQSAQTTGLCDYIKWFAGPSHPIDPFDNQGRFTIFSHEHAHNRAFC